MDPQEQKLSSEPVSSTRSQNLEGKEQAACPKQDQGQGQEIQQLYGSDFEQGEKMSQR